MKKMLFIISLSCIFILTHAQKGLINGWIRDQNGVGLPGANIVLENGQGTISDFEGNFYIYNLEAGSYILSVSYIGYSPFSEQISVEAGKTITVDIVMDAGIELKDVIVNARRAGEAKALNAQKNADNITTIIAAEQLERFPDNNIGDALKRIPGINVQYDQGEARFGNIRGTAPELNSITINGERIPSAEAEIRSVQLDLLPSDMVQTVEYNKAITPDMDADAIGGSINLITKTAPYKKELSGKIGSGYNFISGKPTVKGSITYSQRFFQNKIGLILSASGYDNPMGSDNIEAEWDYSDSDDKDGSAYMTDFQNRQYFVERLRQSYSISLDYTINSNHTIYLKGIYNHRNDWENRFRLRYKDIEWDDEANSYTAEIRRQTKFGLKENKYSRLEDQRMMNYSIGGDHLFGKLKIDWSGSFAKANEERPHERYITYRAKDVLVDIDYSKISEPIITYDDEIYSDFSPKFSLKELTEEYQYTEEIDKNFKINFEIPLLTGTYENKLKFGLRYRGKQKDRSNEFYEYSPVDENAEETINNLVYNNLKDVSDDVFMAGNYSMGNFVDPKISDKMNLEDATLFEKESVLAELAGNFNASEDVYAGYFMVTQNFSKNISIIAGLRLEQTNLEYQGYEYYEEIVEEDETTGEETIVQEEDLIQTERVKDYYLNIMPGLHAKYTLNKNTNIRFAWTNTISRPNYFDLVPYQEINEDNEISLGNPNLKPTTSMNFDLLGEYFFENVGVITTGIFYKDISDVIAFEFKADYEYKGNTYDEYRKPKNIGNASLYGVEFGLSRKLSQLPWLLKNLTVYGNYTYIKSKLEDITYERRENEKIPMGGTPNHTYNLSLAFDTKKFDIRISFNHASSFLNNNDDGGLGEEAFFDFYYEKVNYLDLNADYKINNHWKLYASVNNLLNQPLKTYWGISDRTAQAEYYGVKFNFGTKFKF